jgi:glycerol uptake facilitator-like aquaporin
MFLVYFPITQMISNEMYVVYQFLAVIFFDILTNGAPVNPAVVIGLYLKKVFTFKDSIAYCIGNLIAAYFAYPMLNLLMDPSRISGPVVMNDNLFLNLIIESLATFSLMMGIFFMDYFGPNTKRIFIASVIRLIIFFSASYANFNPMVIFIIFIIFIYLFCIIIIIMLIKNLIRYFRWL